MKEGTSGGEGVCGNVVGACFCRFVKPGPSGHERTTRGAVREGRRRWCVGCSGQCVTFAVILTLIFVLGFRVLNISGTRIKQFHKKRLSARM